LEFFWIIHAVYATCRRSLQDCPELVNLNLEAVISDVDVTNDIDMKILLQNLQNVSTIDIVIHNAGYFMTERESMLQNTMNYPEELQMINICAVSTLRVTQVLYSSNKLQSGSKVVMITSQGGSISWRKAQCPNGGDYGHHMSKAAANMAGTLLANEFQSKGIIVPILHPGFVRTDMTRKYSSIWDEEGAVDSNVGAKRVLHEISRASMETSGVFVNCEDGLEIPW
jgi:NAD(P)-dependent dehydrogenase (short-subunit alcohol dehydrogenase family)